MVRDLTVPYMCPNGHTIWAIKGANLVVCGRGCGKIAKRVPIEKAGSLKKPGRKSDGK